MILKKINILIFLLLTISISANINKDLINASKIGNIKKVIKAIKNGANVNFSDKNGYTPLLYAVESGKIVIVGLLIQKNTNDLHIIKESILNPDSEQKSVETNDLNITRDLETS